ncbi:MAG: hypothetical protein C3F17_18670 [Bradyrhizobiaceae bacterium]|nr:MAG: hypothetical protein C3F17_18670 [Bradyrhizobiaceae bacterium]
MACGFSAGRRARRDSPGATRRGPGGRRRACRRLAAAAGRSRGGPGSPHRRAGTARPLRAGMRGPRRAQPAPCGPAGRRESEAWVLLGTHGAGGLASTDGGDAVARGASALCVGGRLPGLGARGSELVVQPRITKKSAAGSTT